MNPSRNRNRLIDLEQTLVAKCGGEEGMDGEFGMNRHKLLYTEWINNKVLLYTKGNYIQHLVTNHNGKNMAKNAYFGVTKQLC